MKPILYAGDETRFISNGMGRLADCTRCEVTEERNGVYLCEFDIPVTSPIYPMIQEGRYVGAIHDDRHDIQPFEIYGRTAPIDGLVTFFARHISYKLSNVILKPFTASNCAQALAKMETETYNENPFTFWTDKQVTAPFANDVPASCRSLLAGQEGSILDVYGTGEYEFDKWEVKLYLHRGADNGVSIRYGVNLTDIEHDKDISSSFSAVAPYWKSEEDSTIVTLPEGYIVSPDVTTTLYPWTTETGEFMTDENGTIIDFDAQNVVIAPLDLSQNFDTRPTVAQLRAAALAYMANNSPWLPKDSITVSFVDMAHTEDYKDVAALQRVSLCDRVNVYCGPLGVNAAQMQVIRTVYNVLDETYNEIELGETRPSFADTVMSQVEKKNYVSKSVLDAAVEHATDLITGGLGGYVVFNMNADGQPEEILIMDTPDTQTAVNVWRFNKNGLGHSHNGYDGPFNDVALTADGQINANMITTGYLLATIIKAGILSAANNSGNFWNMETGEFVLKSDNATNGIIYRNGVLTINASNITTGTLLASLIKAGILSAANNSGNFWNMETGDFVLTSNNATTGIIYRNGVLTISASNITVGDLSANRIKGGTLTLGGANNVNGALVVKDNNNNNMASLDRNGLSIDFTNTYSGSTITGKVSVRPDFGFELSSNSDTYTYITMNTRSTYTRLVVGRSRPQSSTQYYGDTSIDFMGMDFYTYRNGTSIVYGGIDKDGLIWKETSNSSFSGNERSFSILSTHDKTYDVPVRIDNMNLWVRGGNFSCDGTKSRVVSTNQYSDRLLYCYETPSPLFGDVGEGIIGDDGRCYIWVDAVFAQTITTSQYQVFLQKYGAGDCWVAERKPGYYVVEGTPGLAFGWELKAKQSDFDQIRLEKAEEPFTPATHDYGADAVNYLNDLIKERMAIA